jgi:hypothetical protein
VTFRKFISLLFFGLFKKRLFCVCVFLAGNMQVDSLCLAETTTFGTRFLVF